ncbi:MAG: glycosyl hydrolase [Patescibacteria group bacterium]|jgi:hypothetical protein
MKKIWLIILLFPVYALSAGTPVINSVSSDFISVIDRTEENSTTIAVYGDNFADLIFNDNTKIYLGDLEGQNITGNDEEINATFYFSGEIEDDDYYLKILNTETNEILYNSSIAIRIFNPYSEEYQNSNIKKFLKKSTSHKANKRRVGLNVHQAMAGENSNDAQYLEKLQNSETKWVREHFSHALIMGIDQKGWITRYDKIMEQYENENIRVVGMLAYDYDQDYTHPSLGAWKKYVRYVVRRYRNYVDVWELWNEPDSDTYLSPSDMNEYKPLLKYGYKLIKYYDPDSIVLNGGVSDITHLKFIDSLYRRGRNYFDALNIHLYYCDEFIANGNNNAQREDVENLEALLERRKNNKKIWVTEIGCSTGHKFANEKQQKSYLKKSIAYLLNKNEVQNILIYTARDRDLNDEYEANFGLFHLDFSNKKIWQWYRML